MSSKNTKQKSSALIKNTGGFPPVLPAKYRKVIDGVNVTAVRIEFTQFGTKVLVVKKDGNIQSLDEYLPSFEQQKKDKRLTETIALYSRRIDERKIGIEKPNVTTLKEMDEWIKSLDPNKRKILLMNASTFRASKRKSAKPEGKASTSDQTKSDEI